MSPITYYEQIRFSGDLRSLRYQLVRYAQQHGIKPTARIFHTTPRTVRKWLKRWSENPPGQIVDRRGLRKIRKSGISAAARRQAIDLKMKHPMWGAVKIKKHYSLALSDKAIRKIWKEVGLAEIRKDV